METAYLLITTTFVTLTGVYEAVTIRSYPAVEQCEAAGEQAVNDRSEEIAATGEAGVVWFHCQEVQGRQFGEGALPEATPEGEQ